jgi:hypothetical protein
MDVRKTEERSVAPQKLSVDSKHAASATNQHDDLAIVSKMKKLEEKLAEKQKSQAAVMGRGHLLVNGPLPANFANRFVRAVGSALGINADELKVLDATATRDNRNIVEVSFQAPVKLIKRIGDDAADADSKLAQGDMRQFLVAKDDDQSSSATAFIVAAKPRARIADTAEVAPVQQDGIDIDTAMPYGDLEPFGREDTAQELTEDSIKESDGMVDQLERAEVAEEKRAVFRALTRLRGAAITSFDGIARSQTGNIDEYNKIHQWRRTHPLHHLADEESDVSKWAFPDNADF